MLRGLGGFIIRQHPDLSYLILTIGAFKPKFCDKAIPHNPSKEIQKTNAGLVSFLRQLHLPRISNFLFDKRVWEFCHDKGYSS